MKTTVTATFPGGIGEVEISRERADQILRLQKMIKKNNELIILKKAEQKKDYPLDVIQSWRHTTIDPLTGKLKMHPIFYIRQTLSHKSERVSLALGIELVRLKKCELTFELNKWMMGNGYEEVVKQLLFTEQNGE